MTDLNDLPLSQTGQQRRERMLDDLLTHLRTHHRRRRIRRQANIASPLLVLAIVCVSWYANLRTSPQVQRPPIAQQQPFARAIPIESVTSEPTSVHIVHVQTDPTILARFRANAAPHAVRIDDDALREALARTNRGMIRSEGRTWLIAHRPPQGES